MHHVIELHFDSITEHQIRAVWKLMKDLEFAQEADYFGACPHISLTSSEPIDPNTIQDLLSQIATTVDFNKVEFSFLGIFLVPANPIFLGITPNRSLLDVQEILYSKLLELNIKLHPLYAPNKIVFHTTLIPNSKTTEFSDPLRKALNENLPSFGLVESIALVEYPSGRRLVEERILVE